MTLNVCACFYWIDQLENSFYDLLLHDAASPFTRLSDYDKTCAAIFFPSIQHFLFSARAPSLSTPRYTALSYQTRSGDGPPKNTNKLCLFCVSHMAHDWYRLLTGGCQRLCCECEQVERLITQHLRPFFPSPFMMQPAMSVALTNQKWAGISGVLAPAAASLVPVMATHLAKCACPLFACFCCLAGLCCPYVTLQRLIH